MKRADFDELKVVKSEIPYSKVVDFINFVVANSFSKTTKQYHEYLTDYSEAVAILTMYTDCKDYDMSFDDVMDFVQSDKWAKIKDELGDIYINFHYYVKKEIEYLNTPLRFADSAMGKAIEVMESINNILKAIDVEALKNYDFSKITEAIDALDSVKQEEKKEVE